MEGDRAREMFLAHDVAVGRERRVRGGRTKSVWRCAAKMDTSICVNRARLCLSGGVQGRIWGALLVEYVVCQRLKIW